MDFLGINMLIEVDIKKSQLETALDRMDSNTEKSEFLSGLSDMFSDLLYSSSKGYHRIFVNRNIFRWAKSNLDLNSREIDRLLNH